jgi:hypothetical protein
VGSRIGAAESMKLMDHDFFENLSFVFSRPASIESSGGGRGGEEKNTRSSPEGRAEAAFPTMDQSSKQSLLGLAMHRCASGLEVRRVDEKSEAGESTFPFSYGDVVVTIDGLDVVEGAGEVSAAVEAANKLGKATVGILKENAGEVIMVTIGAGGSGGKGGAGAGAAVAQAGGKSWQQLLETEEWVAGELGGSDYEDDLAEEGEDEDSQRLEDGEGDDGNEAKIEGEEHEALPPRDHARKTSSYIATVETNSSSTVARGSVRHASAHPNQAPSSTETPLQVVSGLSHAMLRRILLGVLTREMDAEAQLARVLVAATSMCKEGWEAGGASKQLEGTVVHFLVEHTRPEVGLGMCPLPFILFIHSPSPPLPFAARLFSLSSSSSHTKAPLRTCSTRFVPQVLQALPGRAVDQWLRCLRVLPPADSLPFPSLKEGPLRKKGQRFKMWHQR